MRTRRKVLLGGSQLALVGLMAANAHPEDMHRVDVLILHSESSVRTSVANRDAYIAQIESKSGRFFGARIIDQYPGYISAPTLLPGNGDGHYSVSLRRVPYCDGVIEGKEVPCFEASHSSWRIRKASTDQWWK